MWLSLCTLKWISMISCVSPSLCILTQISKTCPSFFQDVLSLCWNISLFLLVKSILTTVLSRTITQPPWCRYLLAYLYILLHYRFLYSIYHYMCLKFSNHHHHLVPPVQGRLAANKSPVCSASRLHSVLYQTCFCLLMMSIHLCCHPLLPFPLILPSRRVFFNIVMCLLICQKYLSYLRFMIFYISFHF